MERPTAPFLRSLWAMKSAIEQKALGIPAKLGELLRGA